MVTWTSTNCHGVPRVVLKRIFAVLLFAIPVQVLAQWEVITESLPDSDGEIPVAIVRNDDGHSLKIYEAQDGTVRGIFSIGNSYEALAAQTCPTYFVDDHKPEGVRFGEARCRLEPNAAYFTLGEDRGDTIRSASLQRLMNGTDIHFLYHVNNMGYRESSFSLSRSKQALTTAVGSNVTE